MVGFTMFSAQLFQDMTSRAMCINMVTCLMNLVGVEIVPPWTTTPSLPSKMKIQAEYPITHHQQLLTLHQQLITFIGCAELSLFGLSGQTCFICFMLFVYYSYIIVSLLVMPMTAFCP